MYRVNTTLSAQPMTSATPATLDAAAMQAHSDAAARLLKALANAQRLNILCRLVGTELTVGQINEYLPELSQSALSQHLARLRDEQLVVTRHAAQNVWYSLSPGPAEVIIAALHGIYCTSRKGRGTRRRNP